jgi:hypothetical protein
MATRTIQQGECLSSIAAELGLKSWKDIYYHPDNTDLRSRRTNPNVVARGDVSRVRTLPP